MIAIPSKKTRHLRSWLVPLCLLICLPFTSLFHVALYLLLILNECFNIDAVILFNTIPLISRCYQFVLKMPWMQVKPIIIIVMGRLSTDAAAAGQHSVRTISVQRLPLSIISNVKTQQLSFIHFMFHQQQKYFPTKDPFVCYVIF